MSVTLGQIAHIVGGDLVGDPDLRIVDAATICRVCPGQITFVSNPKHWPEFVASTASAAIVSGIDQTCSKPIIRVGDAETAFAKVVAVFRPPLQRPRRGISPHAFISSSAVIEDDVDIYPNAFIGDGTIISHGATIYPGVCILENCRIGRGATIFPNAVLYENTVIGDGSIIHAGVVLGAYGFGYRTRDGKHDLGAQLGSVQIGNQVELGANTTVDRGTFEATKIGDGTKIDDQVMVGHNCNIGKHNILCSQVGIAGSCTTGDYVVMAGQVGIGDHIRVGERSVLGAKAGVMHDIPANETLLGAPATPIREQMQILACIAKLPEWRSQIRGIARDVASLQNILTDSADRKAA